MSNDNTKLIEAIKDAENAIERAKAALQTKPVQVSHDERLQKLERWMDCCRYGFANGMGSAYRKFYPENYK